MCACVCIYIIYIYIYIYNALGRRRTTQILLNLRPIFKLIISKFGV